MTNQKNVFDQPLEPCCSAPITGFYRDGFCHTGDQDYGKHIICTEMTAEFLEFSKQAGNDLSTPRPEFHFPGLKPGDRWCVCISRWIEAYQVGVIAPVILESSHKNCLDHISLIDLQQCSVEPA